MLTTTKADDVADLTPAQKEALRRLLHYLEGLGYHFVTPTPATHARVMARAPARQGTRREDVLGWSLAFAEGAIDPVVESLLADAGALIRREDGLMRSAIRVSTVHERLFIHSAFPTVENDAVFLGPDSYRFAELIARMLKDVPAEPDMVAIDIGTGSGVGAILAADALPGASVAMTDVNPRALALAAINARHAGHAIEARHGRNLAGWEGEADVILANPPYIVDRAGRAYRDGGAMHGTAVALEMTGAALAQLRRGGMFILYTGSAIIEGEDPLTAMLARHADDGDAELAYREIDPDVFGEELESPAYRDVDRIAVVSAVFRKR